LAQLVFGNISKEDMKMKNNLFRCFRLLLPLLVLFIVLCSTMAWADYTYPFQDQTQPLEIRVNDLLLRLTEDEKISFFHQWIPAISRLGIQAFRTGTEALHGISWLGAATVFPQATGFGCTWDVDLIKQIGSAVADEARGFNKIDPVSNGLSLWAPVVDLERDPRAGRFEEGYSEDPYLVGQLAIAYCSGIKGDHPFYYKAIPTLKHFYAYNLEANRDTFSVNIDDRNKHEYYLKSFQYPVTAGVAKSLMTSYNFVNGIPNTVAPEINAVVKDEWARGKDFFVVTDAYSPNNLISSQSYYTDAAHSHAGMIKAGIDSMTQDSSDNTNTIKNIKAALALGLITIADIDNGVKNILRVRFHTGEFDTGGNNPYKKLGTSEICAPAHAVLALKAAREQLVLLKNSNKALPLHKEFVRKVAVIGPLADQVLTDFYSAPFPYTKSVLTGVQTKIASDKIIFTRGLDQIALKSIANSQYVTAPVSGGQLTASATTVSVNETFDLYDFGWGQYLLRSHANDKYLTGNGNSSANVLNTANAPGVQSNSVGAEEWFTYQNFKYELQTDGTYSLYNYQVSHWDTGLTGGKYVTVDTNAPYALNASQTNAGDNEKFQPIVLVNGLNAAANAAYGADAAIVVVGNEPMLNSRETIDRQEITLPPYQEQLIQEVAAVNPNTIVVVVSSYPMAMGVVQNNPNVKAILYSSHGGQEEGTAIADAIFGDYAPAGRLNSTWYSSLSQLPAITDFDIINGKRTYMYFEGTPLYPFGYGLTYTTFQYSNLRLKSGLLNAHGRITVSVDVKNTGSRASDEVIQLYVKDLQPIVKRPIRELKGFKRIYLAAGAIQTVSFNLPASELAYWDVTRNAFYVKPGDYSIMVGRSSADIQLTTALKVF
jgi:beta-glucosidase